MNPMRDFVRFAPAAVLGVSTALLLGALAFQYLGGLKPCPLCLWQRYPHGIVIALGLVAVGLGLAAKPTAVPWLLILAGLVLLVGAGIAAFHVGVEQGWWKGLEACAAGGGTPTSLEEAKKLAEKGAPARCDDVAWSLFGISMAGYNVLISLATGLFAFWAARQMMRARP